MKMKTFPSPPENQRSGAPAERQGAYVNGKAILSEEGIAEDDPRTGWCMG